MGAEPSNIAQRCMRTRAGRHDCRNARCLIVRGDRAAQAEAEVERSEGEGEAQSRPVVVSGASNMRCIEPWRV